jgi:hypothetical protein
MKLQEGPWGGGNQFGQALKYDFTARGIEVSHDLDDPDLDFIMLCEPRRKLKISAYTDRDIFNYLARKNPRALVVHRINECDERKGTTGVNRRLLQANLCADHTVFISEWLRRLFIGQGFQGRSSNVILNGSDRAVFHPRGHVPWDGNGPLRLVTHHWSRHPLKGMDIYERIERLLDDPAFAARFSFTYIGKRPEGFELRNTRYVEPTSGAPLADLLRAHHVYVTASRNEPCGNHQIEGANCGLPVLYIEDGGGLGESVRDYGLAFTTENFEGRLEEMRSRYPEFQPRMASFPHSSTKMAELYYATLMDLNERRNALLSARSPIRRIRWRWREFLRSGDAAA